MIGKQLPPTSPQSARRASFRAAKLATKYFAVASRDRVRRLLGQSLTELIQTRNDIARRGLLSLQMATGSRTAI